MTQGPILIVGRNGQVARCLQELASKDGVIAVALGRRDLDLETRDEVAVAVAAVAPSVIINTAAYTAVDRAESDEASAFRINRDGAAALATVAARTNIPFVHLSTDYVFDGTKPTAYDESDTPAPLNVYGSSKLAGEIAVLSACPFATVIRSAWIYSPYGTNFVQTMKRLSQTRPIVRVVDDQRGNPTSALDLAAALLRIAQLSQTVDRGATAGTYHIVGDGEATWHSFAAAIFDGLGRRGLPVPRLEAISTEEYPTPARRPRNSRLDSSKAERVFGIRLPPWRRSLERCLDQLVAHGENVC
jgi:dTDP-4-dehydrorhamnose reductase